MFLQTDHFSIYFGTAADTLYVSDSTTRTALSANPFAIKRLEDIATVLSLTSLTLLHQVHSALGFAVEHLLPLPGNNLTVEGDYLISASPQLGLGIFTADCLPVMCYDTKNHALGLAHAGWKGALAAVVPTMLDQMRKHYGTQAHDLTLFFGPSARHCCYEVQHDFVDFLKDCSFKEKVLEQRSQRFYFDLPTFVTYQLGEYGIPAAAINQTYSRCTICDPHYFSHRRQGIEAGRNITIATLKRGVATP
jgi:YfiH family protein